MSRRKVICILLGLVVLLALAGFLFISGQTPSAVPPGIAFTGKESIEIYRGGMFREDAAGFSIKNRGPDAISVHEVQVQVFSNNVWRTVFKGMPQFPPVYAGGPATNRFSGCVEPAEEGKFTAPWLGQGLWRARFLYGRELKGGGLLATKLRITWRSRDLSIWRAGGRSFGDSEEVLSDPISK